jgi:hypothetical protein
LRLWEYGDKGQSWLLRLLLIIQYVIEPEGFLNTKTMHQFGEDLRVRLDRFKALDVFHREVDAALMLPLQGLLE